MYAVKIKSPGPLSSSNEYLNKSKTGDLYYLSTRHDTDEVQTLFNKEEIDELDRQYDMSCFIIERVSEDEARFRTL